MSEELKSEGSQKCSSLGGWTIVRLAVLCVLLQPNLGYCAWDSFVPFQSCHSELWAIGALLSLLLPQISQQTLIY